MKTLLFVLSAIGLLACGCQKPAAPVKTVLEQVASVPHWQYVTQVVDNSERTVTGDFDFAKLDKMGEQGWELVSAIPQQAANQTSKIILIFKRPL